MNYSVEAEGIDFILRFRDEASSKINMAEKGYQKLVSAMQSLITTQRAFSDSILETLNTASIALKNNPFPIATPITITQDQVAMMGQFESQAVSWFRNMGSQMNSYISRVGRAVTVTNKLHESIKSILADLKAFGKDLQAVVPFLAQFATFKLPEFKSRGIRRILSDLQQMIGLSLEWAKTSPEFRKAANLTEEQVESLSKKFDELQNNAQKSNFHTKDFRDSLKETGDESDKTSGKLGGFLGILDKIGKAKYTVTGIVGGVLFGQGVQKYASVEDAAFAIRQSIGATAGTVGDLTDRLRSLSLNSGFSAESVAGAFALIAQKSGHITKATDQLAILSVEFGKLTNTSAELAGEMTGTLVGAFGLSEEAAGQFLKMANLARQGSRGLMGPEFIQAMTQNVEEIKKLSQTMGMQSDEFLKKNASSMMALQKEFSVIYGDVNQVQDAMKGAVAIVGDDASKIRKLLTGSGRSYEEFRDKIKQGHLDDAFIMLAESWQKRINQIPDAQKAVFRRMFSQSTGIAEDQLNQMERLDLARIRQTRLDLDNTKKVNETFEQGVSEWKSTFNGILEQLNAIWGFFQSALAPVLKVVLFTLQTLSAFLVGGHNAFGKGFDWIVSLITLTGSGLFVASSIRNITGLARALKVLAGAETAATAAGSAAGWGAMLSRFSLLGTILAGIAYSVTTIMGDINKENEAKSKGQVIDRSKGVMGFGGRHRTGVAPLDWLDTFIMGPEPIYKDGPTSTGSPSSVQPPQAPTASPQQFKSPWMPSPITPPMFPMSYNEDSGDDNTALLQKVAETGDNTGVVNELRKISTMLNTAMGKMAGREPMTPKFGHVARSEI